MILVKESSRYFCQSSFFLEEPERYSQSKIELSPRIAVKKPLASRSINVLLNIGPRANKSTVSVNHEEHCDQRVTPEECPAHYPQAEEVSKVASSPFINQPNVSQCESKFLADS